MKADWVMAEAKKIASSMKQNWNLSWNIFEVKYLEKDRHVDSKRIEDKVLGEEAYQTH